MKRVGKLLGLALLGVLAVCVMRTLRLQARSFEAAPEVRFDLDPSRVGVRVR